MLLERHFPLPIGKTRLFSSIFMAFVSAFFILLSSTKYSLFTPTYQMYLAFGIFAGLLFGVIETRIVIPKLAKNVETFVWQVTPLGIVLFGVPLLLVTAFLGVSEYLPFGLYAFFPFITAAGAISGWYFNKFEKINKADVFMFYYGFKYWIQPNPDYNERFQYFLKDLVSKDPSNFWGQIGSSFGYVGYSKIFINILKEKQEIPSSTKEELINILKTMNKYRIAGLTILGVFLLSTATLFSVFFGSVLGYIQLNFRIIDYLVPISGIIFSGFAISVIVLVTTFKRRIPRMVKEIDSNKLPI